MILGEDARAPGTAATLDDLFRRAGVRHPDALALADPPNRESFADNAPRTLSFAQTDRAISAFATRLRGLGLQTDSVVAIHLPNTVESIVAFMGVLRAGMIAVPLPVLWRQAEIAAALTRVGAKAIVTCSRIGTFAPCRSRQGQRGRIIFDPSRLWVRARSAGRHCASRRHFCSWR
jgi:acyl-CoA synthetase (AMP-forming)/AMP-acid ligase II